MSQTFLYELFQKNNLISLEGERCGICLEEYNSLSRETGSIEVGIRLPCDHIVGSACIATWLKENNTCPLCRREFFQAQPRPSPPGNATTENDEESGERRVIRETIEDICHRLELDVEISLIARYLEQKLTESGLLNRGHTQLCVIAVAIYIGSYITRRPRSPGEIGEMTGMEAAHIRQTYDIIFPQRERLTDVRLLSLLEEAYGETGLLNYPSPGNEVSDDEIERGRMTQMLRRRCEAACNQLGLDAAIAELATKIATRFCDEGLTVRLSAKEMIAACIFMSGRMMDHPIRCGHVAEAVRDIAENFVWAAYGVTHAYRDVLLLHPALEDVGSESVASRLLRLPRPTSTLNLRRIRL